MNGPIRWWGTNRPSGLKVTAINPNWNSLLEFVGKNPRSVLLSIQIADAHNIIMVTFFEKSGSIIRSYNHNKILVQNHKKLAKLPPKYVHEKSSKRHYKYLLDFGLLLKKVEFTGKSMSEALILEWVNPQYDERLFIDFQEKYKFTTCCVQKLFSVFVLTFKTIFVHNMLWTCIFLGIQWTISRHIVG